MKSLLILWVSLYAMLLGIYFLLGALISFLNARWNRVRKIQARECPRSMVARDIKQSIHSLALIALFLALGGWLQQQGYGWIPAPMSALHGALLFAASLLLFDTWFYWLHRLLHVKGLYKRIHAWHHQAVTPTIWSNNSDTFLDTFALQSYFLAAVFLLPIPFELLVLHKIFDQVTGMIGHCGHEYFPGKMSRFPSPFIGVTFHDQHHQHVSYNYSTHFSLWDRLMRTVHPDYDRVMDEPKVSDPAYPGGKRAALSFTFDDGSQSQIDLALPLLEEFGFKATFFIIPGLTRERKTDPVLPDRSRSWWADVSWEEWRAIAARGHEIGNHSLTHPVLPKHPDPQREILESARLITGKLGQPPTSFCFPFNRSNPTIRQLALRHHEFVTHRRARDGGPWFSLRRANRRVDRAIRRHGWLVAMFHGIGSGFDPVKPDVLRRHLEYIQQRKDVVWVDTFTNVSRWIQSGQPASIPV